MMKAIWERLRSLGWSVKRAIQRNSPLRNEEGTCSRGYAWKHNDNMIL